MTNDKSKTKAQLLDEIVRLKKQIRDDHSRVLFENTPLPYQSLDKEGNILAVNTAWIELLGYEKEKVIGRFIGDFLVPDHAKVLKENFLDFVTSGKMNHADFTMIKRDGSRILITIKGRIGYDELGNFSQTHCLLHDLTEQRRAEKELSASEQRFRGLFESSIDGIFHVDTFGSILNVNPAFCAILGFVSDDLLGKNIIDITPRKWYSVEKKIFREKVMPDGYSEEFEKEYLHKDGHPVPVTTRIWLTRDEEGAPIGSWGVVRDLTSQKDVEKEVAESEQQLRESENSLRVLLNATVDSVGLFSLDGTILIINQNMADSMGHSIEDLIGQNIFKYFSRKVVKKRKINFDMAAKSNTPQFMKEVYSGRIIDSVTYPILGESGEVSSLAVYAKDVTDTILSEQAQKQSDERYRRIVETADEGIIGFDANQCITYANQITVDFFGYELEETVGASLYDLLLPEDIGAYKKRMEQRARGERERYEQRFVRKDGEMVWGLVSATPILAEDGHYLGSFAMITDITERKKTEEALNLTQFSVDRASIDIYWINADGRFVYANDHACESLGYTLEELLTMTVPDINPYFLPEDWPGYWFERRQYGIKQFETVHQRKDGSQFPVGITSHYWRYGDQDYLFTYSYDLSERKQAEEKLKHSQELLNEVQRISLTGGWEVDMLTRETIWTNGQFQLHGLEPGVVPADIKRFFEFYVHPADQTKLAEAWQTVITKHTAVEVEYRSIKADGIESVLVVVATPDVDKTGKLRRVFGSTRDVTKERQAAQDLKQAHERLLTILDGIDADVYVSDLETHEILFMNAHMREYFGSPTKDVPCHKVFRGETEPCLFCPKPSLLDAQGNPVGTVIGERYSPLTRRWYLDHDRVIEWLEGKQVHMHMAADITEIKTMAEDLKLAMGEAQAASIAKNEFLANMSHEIRTPLNGLLGMLQLLQLTSLVEEQRDYLDTAFDSGRGLLQILNDILDLSKIESGKLELDDYSFELGEVLDSVVAVFRRQAESRGLVMSWKIDESRQRQFIGDKGRLRQILFNLVGNAAKFTESGTIVVEAYPLEAFLESGQVLLYFAVTDTGIGIPDDKVVQVFDPFTQVDGSFSRKYQGTGLGLGIVRRLVKLMGGTISIVSQEGKGTSIVFTIAVTPDWKRKEVAIVQAKPDSKGLSVLVAEDERVNRAVVQRLLSKLGYNPLCVKNGEAALERLKSQTFDCVLMDIQMPGLNGLDTTRVIRQKLGLDVPVVALTAHAMKGDRQRFIEAGMNGYISKPFDLDELQKEIERVVAESAT